MEIHDQIYNPFIYEPNPEYYLTTILNLDEEEVPTFMERFLE